MEANTMHRPTMPTGMDCCTSDLLCGTPQNTSKICSQRCWLPINIFNKLKFQLNSAVRLKLKNGTDYIGRSWVQTGNNKFIQLEKSVYKNNVNSYGGRDIAVAEKYVQSVEVEKFSCLQAAQKVTLSVVFKEKQKDKHGECVRNILTKYMFSAGYIIDCSESKLGKLYGVCRILIKEVDGEHGDVFHCSANTEFIIKEMTTWERYFQRQCKPVPPPVSGVPYAYRILERLILAHNGEGVKQSRGALLVGPSGTGKTCLVRHVAHDCRAFLLSVERAEILSSNPGETEENLSKIFLKAISLSLDGERCLIFLDEIDCLCPARDKIKSAHDYRTVVHIFTLLDKISSSPDSHLITVVAATNRPAALDLALRRPGRLDKEIVIGVPNENERLSILQTITAKLSLAPTTLENVAKATVGYVGADLVRFCRETVFMKTAVASNCTEADLSGISYSWTDFENALRVGGGASIQAGMIGAVDCRKVKYDDIGGLMEVKKKIQQAVEWPLLHADVFAALGLCRPRGVLLYGPPGCAKTTLVCAAATSCNVAFLSVSGAEIYSPFVGDAERAVSQIFQQASMMAPCILFLDELDAMVGQRDALSRQSNVNEKVLSALLNEMDGIGQRTVDSRSSMANQDVLIVGASNRPDLLDSALLRPGRFDRLVYVPLPDLQTREAILKVHTKNMPLADDVKLDKIAETCEHHSGADLENLCREAALGAITEEGTLLHKNKVTEEHFKEALQLLCPHSNKQPSSLFAEDFLSKER